MGMDYTTLKFKAVDTNRRTVSGIDADGTTPRSGLKASDCTPLQISNARDKSGQTIVPGREYVCSGTKGYGRLIAGGVGGTPGTMRVVGFNGSKRHHFPAKDCMQVPPSGMTAKDSKGVEIKNESKVTCKGYGDPSTFNVKKIEGFPGTQDAKVTGTDARTKSHNFKGKECTVIGDNVILTGKGKGTTNNILKVGDKVICDGAKGTVNMTVKTVEGYPITGGDPNAILYGQRDAGGGKLTDHNFSAKKCMLEPTSGITGIGKDEKVIDTGDNSMVTCKSIIPGSSFKTLKINRITGNPGKKAKVYGVIYQGGQPTTNSTDYTADQCVKYVPDDEMFGLDKSPAKAKIVKGSRVTCKTGIMPAKTFKVEKITGQAGATAQILGPGGKPSYKANECLLADLTANQAAGQTGIGQDNEILTEGMKVTCKARTGPKIFNIQTITGKVGTTAASIRGQGNETYTAGQCSKFDDSGKVFGLDKTTPGKRIEAPKPGPGVDAVKTRVQCKGWGGQKTFYVDTVTGLSGKPAIVMGPGGSPKYTASECTVLEGAPMEAIDTKGATFGENDTVTCTSGVGPLKKTKTFTVATVSGTPGQRASIRGTGNEDYKANQCEARLKTAVGPVKLPRGLSPPAAVNKVAATPGVKEARITELDGTLLASASAAAAAGVGGAQRGGQNSTGGAYKLIVLFDTAEAANMGVEGALNQSGLAAMGVTVAPSLVPVGSAPGDAAAGVPTGSQEVAAAAQAAVDAGAPVVDPAKPPNTPVPTGASTGDAGNGAGAAGNGAGAAGTNTGEPGASAEATGNGEEEPGASAEAPGNSPSLFTGQEAATAAPPPVNRRTPPPPGRAPPSPMNRGVQSQGRTYANIRGEPPTGMPDQGVNPALAGIANASEIGRANPDGIPFPIEVGNYKGILSNGKYYIYYDPFYQKRAANVIIKTGTDATGGPKYGFYRVTGTDQQILNGIRSIRGRGTGDVYDDMIKNLEGQISDNRAELNRLQSAAEQFSGALEDAGQNTQKRGRIGQQLESLRGEIRRTSERIEYLERSIVEFRDEKEKQVKASNAGAY
jgi:hypothetical protein